MFFVFKQKTAYEMRISDWSSDVCSSDLREMDDAIVGKVGAVLDRRVGEGAPREQRPGRAAHGVARRDQFVGRDRAAPLRDVPQAVGVGAAAHRARSEEHTSELQSLMRISYAVFCLKKQKQQSNAHGYTLTRFTSI